MAPWSQRARRMRVARAQPPVWPDCSSDCCTQLETGTQKCWLLSNQAHSNSNYKPNKRPPPQAGWDCRPDQEPGGLGARLNHCEIGNCSQMKREPNGNAKTVPKHKFVASFGNKREGGRGGGGGGGSRLHCALKSFEFIVCAVSWGGGLQQYSVCPSLSRLAASPTCISFSFARHFRNLQIYC